MLTDEEILKMLNPHGWQFMSGATLRDALAGARKIEAAAWRAKPTDMTDPWADFLASRARVIRWFRDDGASFGEIAACLTVSDAQHAERIHTSTTFDPEGQHAAAAIAIYTAVTGKSEAAWCREKPAEWSRWQAAAISAWQAFTPSQKD